MGKRILLRAKKVSFYPKKRICILHYAFLFLVCVLGISSLQASEKKDESNNRYPFLEVQGVELFRYEFAQCLKKVELEKEMYIKRARIKNFLLKNKIYWQEGLKFLASQKKITSPEEVYTIALFIKGMLDSGVVLTDEQIEDITEVYENLIAFSAAIIDYEQKKKLGQLCFQHFTALLLHEKYGEIFQKNEKYLSFCKRHTEKLLQEGNISLALFELSPEDKSIIAVIKYIPLIKKRNKAILLACLLEKIKQLLEDQNLVEVCSFFEYALYFRDMLLPEVDSDEKEQVQLLIKDLKECYGGIINLYRALEYKAVRPPNRLLNQSIVTFLKIFANHPKERKDAVNQLFLFGPILNVKHRKEAYKIVFQDYCKGCNVKFCTCGEESLYKNVKHKILLNESLFHGDWLEQKLNCKQIEVGFQASWPLLPRAYRQKLVEEKFPLKMKMKSNENFVLKASSMYRQISIKEFQVCWEKKTERMSFYYKLQKVIDKVGEGVRLSILNKYIDNAKTSIRHSPFSIRHVTWIIDGFLHHHKASALIRCHLSPLIMKYYDYDDVLISLRIEKWGTTCFEFYENESRPIRDLALNEFLYLDISFLKACSPPKYIYHLIWDCGSKMLLDNLRGRNGVGMQKVALYAFFDFVGVQKKLVLLPNFLFSIPGSLQACKELIPSIFEAWCIFLSGSKHHDLRTFVFGITLFAKFPRLLQKNSYQDYLVTALESLCTFPQAEAYLFEIAPQICNHLNKIYLKKASALFLDKATQIGKSERNSKTFKEKIFSRLPHCHFDIGQLVKFFFSLLGYRRYLRHLGYFFLEDYLANYPQDSDLFIEALKEKQKVKDFLSVCQNQKFETLHLTAYDTVANIAQRLHTENNSLKN